MRAVAIQSVRHARRCTQFGRGAGNQHIVATVHGDDITIGGESSAVESLISMISKSVIEWNRGGVVIEADQRHVREILKGLELEQANRSATPCAVERKNEGKGERRGQGQTQTEHEWSNAQSARRIACTWSLWVSPTGTLLLACTSRRYFTQVLCRYSGGTTGTLQILYEYFWGPTCTLQLRLGPAGTSQVLLGHDKYFSGSGTEISATLDLSHRRVRLDPQVCVAQEMQ